jgi:hypothetical protein
MDKCQGIFSIGGSMNLITGLFQVERQTAPQERIVINQQYITWHCIYT